MNKVPLTDRRGIFGKAPSGTIYPLLPLARIYGAVAALLGWLSSRRSIPRTRARVISVGNLESGGSGKTPTTEALARLLIESGLKPAIATGLLSDSRKRVLFSGTGTFASQAPDEARLLAARLPQVTVACGNPKWRAVEALDQETDCDLVILDDGFQHRRLPRDLDLLCLSSAAPLSKGHPLPAGCLREFRTASSRASALILPLSQEPSPDCPLPVFRYRVEPGKLRTFDGEEIEPGEGGFIAASAIASPQRFEADLAGKLRLVHRVRFRDHADWSPTVSSTLAAIESRHPRARFVITEKDAMRWQDHWNLREPLIAPITLKWENEDALRAFLLEALGFPLTGSRS